jgi:adenylylsulfate kinase
MDGIAIWITGLPGSGKSTLADALNEVRPDFIVLRMDDLRKVVTPEPTYSDAERDMVYRSLVYLARKLTEAGRDVIIDATGNMRKWRDLARSLIPRYAEVYLKCSVEECAQRERSRRESRGAPKDIYLKGEKGWPVPGVNAPYEEPLNPEIVIGPETSVRDAVSLLEDFLEPLLRH